jgi:hypothetical protein
MSVDIDKRGPLFDGRAERAVNDAANDIEKRIALLGASMIRSELARVLRKETPYYRFRNIAEPSLSGWKIHDQGVIYGPWLEGTGSRNRTTRFKGYGTYRRITPMIDARAKTIGEEVMVRYMGRMQ